MNYSLLFFKQIFQSDFLVNSGSISCKYRNKMRRSIILIASIFSFLFPSYSQVYYSYQSGDWKEASTWTHDPGGTTHTATSAPTDGDTVVILTSRTVFLAGNLETQNLNVSINEGAFLDLSTFKVTNGLNVLSGKGTLKLASENFPSVPFVNNKFVSKAGGTTEYYSTSDFIIPDSLASYNNLVLNTSGVATQMKDIEVLGNLNIRKGTFRINDDTSSTALRLAIEGNVEVNSGAHFVVGKGATNEKTDPNDVTGGTAPFIDYYTQFHTVIIKGNFINNGVVRFTNLDYPVYNSLPSIASGTNTGAASVYFMGASDSKLTCNSTTDFYNLILDKGIDKTFSLTVYSTSYGNFRLFGANTAQLENSGANPNLKKALWIRTGSLVLKGLTIIPSLSEGVCGAGPEADYIIPANGALILDGPEVVVLSSADTYEEVNAAYGVTGGTGLVNGVNLGGCSSTKILGKIKVVSGYFSTRETGGFITSTEASGQFEQNGGIVDSKQFRAVGLASFKQTGGSFYLRGRLKRNVAGIVSVDDIVSAPIDTLREENGIDNSLATFNMGNENNVFNVSGGNIQIYDVCSGPVASRALEISSSVSNINVSGGSVMLILTKGSGLPDAASYQVSSTAPLGGLVLRVNKEDVTSTLQLLKPLKILNSLVLFSGEFDANGYDLEIGGNFSLINGSYQTGGNTTIFNGTGEQSLIINQATPFNLENLTIDKAETEVLVLSGTQKSVNIDGNLRIEKGTFNVNDVAVDIAGSVYSSGSQTGEGKIVLSSDSEQVLEGDGSGVFQNLEINKPNNGTEEVVVKDDFTINGTLTFSGSATGYKLLNIQDNNLKIGPSGTVTGADANRYIKTNGEAGNGGVTKAYSALSTSFTFPVGTLSTGRAASEYTPAMLSLGATPNTYGSITVIPVGYEHPNTTTKGRSLTYFWKVKSSGFDLGTATVTHSYTYSQNDVVEGEDIAEAGYVAASYNNQTYTWTKGTSADVNEATNTIGGMTTSFQNLNFIDGEFTAGDDDATDPFGTPVIYYSRQSGLWGETSTWSLSGHDVDDAPGSVPGENDVVIIGANDSVYLGTNDSIPDISPQTCASLLIASGSALDIGFNPGSNFVTVLKHVAGNGNFRLAAQFYDGSTFIFPSGDFSEFNKNLGTTELYTTNDDDGTTFWLPNNIDEYGNLIISPAGGSNIIFGNTDVTMYGSCEIRGENANSWFLPTWNSQYPGGINRISKTITIKGNLSIQEGSLFWHGSGSGGAQDIVVFGNVIVGKNSSIDVHSKNTSQSLSIGGSLINNGDGVKFSQHSTHHCDFKNLPVTFFGETPSYITTQSDTSATIFDSLIVDKGNSPLTTLTIDIKGSFTTPADNWLNLKNGTLIYKRTGDFTVSGNTSFSIPKTAGLEVETPSNVYIANASVNDNDLFLNGQLTLKNGNLYIGPETAPNFNNDIVYSGGGLSGIDIQGGTLTVNGQVRRSPLTASGILKYNQDGGNVVINGNNANTTNAKLEILNSGSTFNMSAGTLSIIRGGGSEYGDLYLRPETSSVTGGEIIFTQGTNNFVQNYVLDATVPLNNLTITGTNSNDATVQLFISPLVVNGDFVLSTANSIFDANPTYNIAVTFNGNFDNNGTYNHYNNHTTFNGGAQNITGTTLTTFYDLEVEPVTSLSLSGDINVQQDLTLSSGTLICGDYYVSVKGDVELDISATYTDNNTGIVLNGTTQQNLLGKGRYSDLELDNPEGARLSDSLTVYGNIMLTQGILDINKYLLTLGENSEINGAPFNDTKMITTDGVFSNIGIKKFFSAGSTAFTYPIGTSGKYTPLELTITANNNVGFVRVNNVNSQHYAVFDAGNALNYFWDVKSSGITEFSGSIVCNYLDSDVLGTEESNYIAASVRKPGNSWSQTNTVDASINTITFDFSSTDNISGEYTAGIASAFFKDIPEFVSNKDGSWNDESVWTQTGGDSYTLQPNNGPNGFIVTVNHTIETDANYCKAYEITINDTFKVKEQYYGHKFGNVYGDGTLYLESENIPEGKYDDFLSCGSNATLEYGGTGSYTIIAHLYDNVPNLVFSGTGTRTLPNKDLTICKRLVIDGPLLDNSVNNRRLTLYGTIERYNTGTFNSGSGTNATISFQGEEIQYIGGATGDFSGNNALNNLEIENSNGLNINTNGDIEVKGNLALLDGVIKTSATEKLTILNTDIDAVVPAGGSSASYVNGPLIKKVNHGDNFIFPIGNDKGLGNKLSISETQSGTQFWTAEYHNPNNYTTFRAPLTAVNSQEYWTVSALAGSKAVVELKWDATSDLTPLVTENGILDMRIADYDGSDWNELDSVASGDNNNGSVKTTNRYTFITGTEDFTIACVNLTKPRARLAPTVAVCGTEGIPVSFTSSFPINLNYVLEYTVNGTPKADTVKSLPYSLPTSDAGTYELTGFKYDGGAGIGVVNSAAVIVYENPTDALAGDKQSLCGGNSTTLEGNSPLKGTGLWKIVSGNGGTVVEPTVNNSVINGVNGNTYEVEWAISNGACISRDTVVIEFPLSLSIALNSNAPICEGEDLNLTESGAGADTWNWTGPNGFTSNEQNPTISKANMVVQGWYVVEASDGKCNGKDSINIVVNSVPADSINSNSPVCIGEDLNLRELGGEATSWNWTGPNGFTSTEQNPVIPGAIEAATGRYFITISNGNCTKQDSLDVLIKGSVTTPVFALGASSEKCQAKDTLTYEASAPNTLISYSLDAQSLSAGNIIDSVTGLVTYSASWNGTTTITATATGCNGSESAGHVVTVKKAPVVDARSNQLSCVKYALPKISGIGLTGGEAYYSGTNGTGTKYNANDLITTSTTLYIFDTDGSCSSEESFTITIEGSGPSLDLVSDKTVCGNYTLPVINGAGLTGNEAYYTETGGKGIKYNTGDILSTTTSLFIYDYNGSCSDEVGFTVTVAGSPEINNPGEQDECDSLVLPVITGINLSGNEAYYTAVGGAGTRYSAGDIIVSDVTLFIFDTTGSCSSEESFDVKIRKVPGAAGEITGVETVCQGATEIGYSLQPVSGATDYNWRYTGTGLTYSGVDNEIGIDFSDTATSGDLIVSGHNTCGEGAPSPPLSISLKNLPAKGGIITGADVVCAGQLALEYFTGAIEYADVHIWTFTGSGGAIDGYGQNVRVNFYTEATSGDLVVRGRNECGDGKPSQLPITIRTQGECAEEALGEISNVFTPNGDNIHDEWKINNIELFPDAEVSVFDRWGRRVFYAEDGYENDWKGDDLPMDNYYYVIDLFGDGKKIIKGNLTIIK